MNNIASIPQQKKLLEEICLIRLILIVLLVLYHAFAPWCGAWHPIDGMVDDTTYWWIGKISYLFMLETFVFISGYIYGHQVSKKGEQIVTLRQTLIKKGKRLLIPSIIFSITYLLCFGTKESETLPQIILSILEGRGHLWFLPMLFWCFIGIWLISRVKYNTVYIILVLVGLTFCTFLPLPLRLSNAMYYMLFFYLGYIVKKSNWNINQLINIKTASLLLVVSLTSFTLLTFINKSGGVNSGDLFIKISSHLLSRTLNLLAAMAGCFACFLFANWIVYVKGIHLSSFWLNLSTYCFGVYLLQQFILQWLYYHSTILNDLPVNSFPWIGFIVTMIVSILITHLSLKSKIGRFLIG